MTILDKLISQYVAPVLREKGYFRKGRRFRIDNPGGVLTSLSFHSYTPYFAIEWDITCRALLECFGGYHPAEGFVHGQVVVPPDWRVSEYNGGSWRAPDERNLDAMGQAIAHELSGSQLENVERMGSTEYLRSDKLVTNGLTWLVDMRQRSLRQVFLDLEASDLVSLSASVEEALADPDLAKDNRLKWAVDKMREMTLS